MIFDILRASLENCKASSPSVYLCKARRAYLPASRHYLSYAEGRDTKPKPSLAMLDKFKSMLFAAGTGGFIWIVVAGIGALLIARRHAIAVSRVTRYAWHTSVATWPNELLAVSAVAIVAALAVGAWVAAMAWRWRWSFTPRRLDSAEAYDELLRHGVPRGEEHIFAGHFGGKAWHVGTSNRALVIGPPETGKTVFLLNQILRASSDRLSFAAVDLKPELAQVLGPALDAAGYRVLRINPSRIDPHSDSWNPLDDITDETELAALIAALLPIRDPKEAPFLEAQRDWVMAAVFHVASEPGGNLPSAYQLLSDTTDPVALATLFSSSSSTVAARVGRRLLVGLSSAKPDPLVVQGVSGALRALSYLALPSVVQTLERSDFSARELGGAGRPIALFLQFEEAKIAALGPLLAFAVTALLSTLIDTANRRKTVALFLDELGNMPPIPNLGQKLNTIRSRKIPTWMYFQSTEQIDERYGKGAQAIFFAAADLQIVFRLNDQPTRELISRLIGTTEREKVTRTCGSSVSHASRSRERSAVIEPHEIGQLRRSEIIALFRGAAARGQATPYFIDFPEFKRHDPPTRTTTAGRHQQFSS